MKGFHTPDFTPQVSHCYLTYRRRLAVAPSTRLNEIHVPTINQGGVRIVHYQGTLVSAANGDPYASVLGIGRRGIERMQQSRSLWIPLREVNCPN